MEGFSRVLVHEDFKEEFKLHNTVHGRGLSFGVSMPYSFYERFRIDNINYKVINRQFYVNILKSFPSHFGAINPINNILTHFVLCSGLLSMYFSALIIPSSL